MTLTLWHDGPHDAPTNMARDSVLLERATTGRLSGTVLRLFTFAPAGITLGRAQEPASELALDRIDRDGVRWAIRPTGGRAIWHEDEWTFSLVTSLSAAGWAMTPAAAYERTGRLFARALGALGVPVVLAEGTPRGPGAPRSNLGAAPPCFASSARHELALDGCKLAGIAQRAVRGALLQQGSLLLGDAHTRLADYVRVSDDRRAVLREDLRRCAATAGARLGMDRSLGRLAGVIATLLPDAELIRGEDGARLLGAEETRHSLR